MYDEWGKPKTANSEPNILCVPVLDGSTAPSVIAVLCTAFILALSEPSSLAAREVLLVQQVIKAVANGRGLGTMLSAAYVASDTSWSE